MTETKTDILSTATSISGVESHDTERRRQIALKALSERLHKSTAGDAKQAAGAGGGTAQACTTVVTGH